MQYKKDFYDKRDSYKVFSSTVKWYLIGVIFLSIVYATVASVFNVDYSNILDSFFVTYFNMFVPALIFISVFYFYSKKRKINFSKASKLNVKLNLKQILILMLIAICSLYFFSPVINLIDYFVSLTNYEATSGIGLEIDSIASLLFGLLVLAGLPALSEELIFRGVVYNGIEKTDGYKKAVILSAVFFMLIHMSVQQTVYQLIIGIVLAYCVYITGSLWSSIVVHFLNNATVVVLSYILTVSNYSNVVIETIKPVSFVDYFVPVLYFVLGVSAIFGLCALLKNVSQKPEQELTPQLKTEDASEGLKQKTFSLLTVGLVITILLWLIDFSSIF